MNNDQKKATDNLIRALDRCAGVGLEGGVFSGSFCIWPKDAGDPAQCDEFFSGVEELGGEVISCGMNLDGGVGN